MVIDISAKHKIARFGTKTSELAKTDLEFGASGPENPPKGVGTNDLSLRRPWSCEQGNRRSDDHD